MQSGISASQELVSQFNQLLEPEKHFGLIVTISDESLRPVSLLTPSSPEGTFSSNVTSLLTPYVKRDEALYILLRRHDAAPYLTAVTYVPDAAHVRQKMLFAATRLTLIRELGSEHFRETIFATTPEELSPAGFQKHDAHTAVDAPLTEEEKTLGDVKRAEQEAGTGTGSREIHLSKSLDMPIAEDALAALKELSHGGGRVLVMLKVNSETEAVELVENSSKPSSISEMVQNISTTEPRFTFFRFFHEHGGDQSSPLLFCYTCPVADGNKSIKTRMLYPLMKRSVLEVAKSEAGLQVDRKFEVEDPSEITEDSVLGELHPKLEVRKAFSKPKRPGR